MKLFVIGSIKIDSKWRKKLFIQNLAAMELLPPLISWQWNFNLAGKYAEFARNEITRKYKQAYITIDDKSFFYNIIKSQVSTLDSAKPESLLFFWQEDHWFVCPHQNLFLYLLDKFQKSKAEVLTITHLVGSWECKPAHKFITDKYLYKEFLVDSDSQMELLKKYPNSYLTSIPGIYKKSIVSEMIEANKSVSQKSKNPGSYELYGENAKKFLSKRSFIEMIPVFHVFREVFKFNKEERAIDMRQAFQIIQARKYQDLYPHFSFRRKLAIWILSPKRILQIIKNKILSLIN